MHNSLLISNYFVNKSLDEGVELTPMKVLKLVYISHGWFLGLTGQPLIDEAVLAWKYGPVVENVYHEFKRYGRGQITRYADITGDGRIDPNEVCPQDEYIKQFLNPIWDYYKQFNGLQLSALTHKPGSPWDRTYREHGEGAVISRDLIKEYYRELGNAPTGRAAGALAGA